MFYDLTNLEIFPKFVLLHFYSYLYVLFRMWIDSCHDNLSSHMWNCDLIALLFWAVFWTTVNKGLHAVNIRKLLSIG